MAKNNGYRIDYTTSTLIMNYKFRDAAEVYGSPEYTMVQAIKKDFPNIKVSIKSGREQKKPRKNKRFTYENMMKHIDCYDNSKALLEMFKRVKKMSAPMKSPYKYVCDWFISQFPDYKETPKFEVDFKPTLTVVPPPDESKYDKKDKVS